MDEIRVLFSGGVDHGKSTLIGRLLYDAHKVTRDQIKEIHTDHSTNKIDFSLITDGLKEERNNKITIDVAYKYFYSKNRKYTLIDAPGHFELTSNMITGATHANVAVVVLDVTKGITYQSKKHIYILSLVGLKKVFICMNKIDQLKSNKDHYFKLVEEINSLASNLTSKLDITFIPMSAINGENVVNDSNKYPWYSGHSLLNSLNRYRSTASSDHIVRFLVQGRLHIENENCNGDFIVGKLKNGVLNEGDKMMTSESSEGYVVNRILMGEKQLKKAYPGSSVTLLFSNRTHFSRGDVLYKEEHPKLQKQNSFEAVLFWLSKKQVKLRQPLFIKMNSVYTQACITNIMNEINWQDYSMMKSNGGFLKLNELYNVNIETSKNVFFESNRKNRGLGRFILIEKETNLTLAVGLIF